MANMKCPVCKGLGKITEDSEVYDFHTRDPKTSRCLICDGSGNVAPRKKLPDGRAVHELGIGRDKLHRLNVSKKAVIYPDGVDTGVGYVPDPAMKEAVYSHADHADRAEKKDYPPGVYYDGSSFIPITNERLNKVLDDGKQFLIVTETEPYYIAVYQMIRAQERKQATWTADDEERYVSTLEERLMELDSRLRGNDGNAKKEASNG